MCERERERVRVCVCMWVSECLCLCDRSNKVVLCSLLIGVEERKSPLCLMVFVQWYKLISLYIPSRFLLAYQGKTSDALTSIKLDLLRTFPLNRFFSNINSEGVFLCRVGEEIPLECELSNSNSKLLSFFGTGLLSYLIILFPFFFFLSSLMLWMYV